MFRIGQYAVYPLRPRTEEPGMKKKVRYAAGAVGAAVPAFGLMVPAAAAAAVPAHKPAVSRKTVALHPRILAAASSTSSGAATGACTGSKEVTATDKFNSTVRFWWKPEFVGTSNAACIGTVEGHTAIGLLTAESYWRVRIYGRNAKGKKVLEFSQHNLGPEPGLLENSHSFVEGIHNIYGALPVQVCMAAVGPFISPAPPAVCSAVG